MHGSPMQEVKKVQDARMQKINGCDRHCGVGSISNADTPSGAAALALVQNAPTCKGVMASRHFTCYTSSGAAALALVQMT